MASYILLFQGGDRAGEQVPVSGPRLTIGRAPDNDLVIQHVTVSSHHAEIVLKGDAARLVDLGSTNGTFHRSRKVERIDLEHGTEFQLGKVSLLFEDEQTLVAAEEQKAQGARRREKAAESRKGMSEEMKALLIGLLGAIVVVAIGFFILSSSKTKRRDPVLDDEGGGFAEQRDLLGEDAGFEADKRSPSVAWVEMPYVVGEISRSERRAAEGAQCLQVDLRPGSGERYLPSVGMRYLINRLPFLPAGGALEFEALLAPEGRGGAALWTRLLVDDEAGSPCTVVRGALASQGADVDDAAGYKRVTARLEAALGERDESPYEIGLLAYGRGRETVRFDAVSAERQKADEGEAERGRVRWAIGDDDRYSFYWSGVGSAYVCRWTHQGRSRRQAFVRNLLFVPASPARPVWMDPNFAPLLAAEPTGSIAVPAAYLGDAAEGSVKVTWSLQPAPTRTLGKMVLELEKTGPGPLPVISFLIPGVLLGGAEPDAIDRFGGDELVANWILDEDAAAARAGEAYPEVASGDEEIDGVRGIAFGPFELRSLVRCSRSVRATTRRVRRDLAIRLHADVADGEKLQLEIGPCDLPTHRELSTRRSEAQSATAQGNVGRAVGIYREILDRAPIIAHAASKQVRNNVRTELGLYRPLERQLRSSIEQAVQEFDQQRRRADQALALGSEVELRTLLDEIGSADRGLMKRYKGSVFEVPLKNIKDRLWQALNDTTSGNSEEGIYDAARQRRTMQLKLADELDERRTLLGESGSSPLGAFLRALKQ